MKNKLFPNQDIGMFKPENLKALRDELEAIAYANPSDSDVRDFYLDAVKELDCIINKIKKEF